MRVDGWEIEGLEYEFGKVVRSEVLEKVKEMIDKEDRVSDTYHKLMKEAYNILKSAGFNVPFRMDHYSLIKYKEFRDELKSN